MGVKMFSSISPKLFSWFVDLYLANGRTNPPFVLKAPSKAPALAPACELSISAQHKKPCQRSAVLQCEQPRDLDHPHDVG